MVIDPANVVHVISHTRVPPRAQFVHSQLSQVNSGSSSSISAGAPPSLACAATGPGGAEPTAADEEEEEEEEDELEGEPELEPGANRPAIERFLFALLLLERIPLLDDDDEYDAAAADDETELEDAGIGNSTGGSRCAPGSATDALDAMAICVRAAL